VARPKRTRPVTAAQARASSGKADEYAAAAGSELAAGRRIAAISLAVHAAINAADAVCGARVGVRAVGEDHDQVLGLLREAGKARRSKSSFVGYCRSRPRPSKSPTTSLPRSRSRPSSVLLDVSRSLGESSSRRDPATFPTHRSTHGIVRQPATPGDTRRRKACSAHARRHPATACDTGDPSSIRSPLGVLASLLDRLAMSESAATIAGFADARLRVMAFPGIVTAMAHLRQKLGDDRFEELHWQGQQADLASMVRYALDAADQARAVLRTTV